VSDDLGLVAGSLVAEELVYVNGAVLALVLIVFIFVFVAYTDGSWFIGAGLLTATVSGLFIFFAWHSLADYPLTYRDGDRPRSTTSGTSLYEKWDDERDLEEVAVQLGQRPIVVRLTANRTDSADCELEFMWENPGFEGPGQGKFRFVFPLPDQ
jgi:hypothetical protein